MIYKLFTINTVTNFLDLVYKPFAVPFEEENPDVVVHNIVDDTLLKDTLTNGMMPFTASKMLAYAQAAQLSGANGVLVTCTSVNTATKYIKPFLNIPIINIEEPVAELAVQNGKKIGVLATLPTSPAAIGRVIEEKANEAGKTVEIINSVVDGAFDVLCSGDRKRHDEMVCEALYVLAEEVDVIAFAQISMSLLPHRDVKVPIFKIGKSGFERIKKLMVENENL